VSRAGFLGATELSGANTGDEGEFMISLKRKYVERYPKLQEVQDNVYEIIEFIMNQNIRRLAVVHQQALMK